MQLHHLGYAACVPSQALVRNRSQFRWLWPASEEGRGGFQVGPVCERLMRVTRAW